MKRQSAFTLIELMIVVTVIAILAAVGFPMYTKQVQKGHRSDAQQLMMDASSKEEQYIGATRVYASSFNDLGVTKDGWSCSGDTCSNNFYDVKITTYPSATPPKYDIIATAKGAQGEDGDLYLDSTGLRKHDGNVGW